MKYFFLVVFIFFAGIANADYINDGRAQFYGRIVFVDQTTVKIQLNCSGNVVSFSWGSIIGITFNDQCVHPKFSFSTSPVTGVLTCKKRTVFVIKFKNLENVSYADTVKLQNSNLRIHFINNKGVIQLSGEKFQDRIEWMKTEEKCDDDLLKDFPVP